MRATAGRLGHLAGCGWFWACAFGIATGGGSVLLHVAYINRSGENYGPIHWLVPGLVLFLGGIMLHTSQDGR